MNAVDDALRLFLLAVTLVVGFFVAGCDHKETLLDVDAPNGGVEVQRSTDTGEITVDVDRE